jgi:hypothetical protein
MFDATQERFANKQGKVEKKRKNGWVPRNPGRAGAKEKK